LLFAFYVAFLTGRKYGSTKKKDERKTDRQTECARRDIDRQNLKLTKKDKQRDIKLCK
jgi:hypothetical protein